jgi:hypothetical protein
MSGVEEVKAQIAEARASISTAVKTMAEALESIKEAESLVRTTAEGSRNAHAQDALKAMQAGHSSIYDGIWAIAFAGEELGGWAAEI